MSFILDALRKSEHARQSLGNTSLAELPVGRRDRRQPWWIIAIALLLSINLIVLVVVLMRDPVKSVPPTQAQSVAQSTATPAAPVASVPAVNAPAPIVRPLSEEAVPQVQYETVDRADTPLANSDGPALVRRVTPGVEVAPNPPSDLSQLHIDMHVFAPNPADRFVYINMKKYVEGDTMQEGPRLAEITTDGVILFYKGQQFRLQRP